MNTTKTLMIALASGLLMAACQQPCPEVEEHWHHDVLSISPDIDTNIAIVHAYMNGLITADEEAIRNATAPEFFSVAQRVPADTSTVDEIVEAWSKNDTTRSDQSIKTIAASCERVAEGEEYAGDWVHFWGRYSATDNATGKSYEVPYFFNARIENYKLVEGYSYFDRLSVFHQLGVDPPGPAGDEESASGEEVE